MSEVLTGCPNLGHTTLKSSVGDPFHFDLDPDPDPAQNPTQKYQFFYFFYLLKIHFSQKLSVLLFMGQIFMSVKHKFNIFEKMNDILRILVYICGNFP